MYIPQLHTPQIKEQVQVHVYYIKMAAADVEAHEAIVPVQPASFKTPHDVTIHVLL